MKARASLDFDVVVQQARYDGLGRRIEKTVDHAGDNDGTLYYNYDG